MAEHSMLHEWIEAVRERQTPEWCNWALQGIQGAVVFHLGAFCDIPPGKPEHWQIIKPPFPVTALEFSYEIEHVRKSGLLLCVESLDADGFYVIPAEKVRGGGWITGEPIRGWRNEAGVLIFETSSKTEPSGVLIARWALAATVFNLLECVNVQVIDNPAPQRLNSKRVAKGNVPLYSFKTLRLGLPNERCNGAALGGTHASPRLHLRRGHIRNLADGRRIWVQSCVVGVGPGVVEKDYRLVAKAAAA